MSPEQVRLPLIVRSELMIDWAAARAAGLGAVSAAGEGVGDEVPPGRSSVCYRVKTLAQSPIRS
jgi:hypothetical protein